jgi:hypothetical protein
VKSEVAATKPAILAALHKHDADSAELHTRRHILEAAGYDTEGSGLRRPIAANATTIA